MLRTRAALAAVAAQAPRRPRVVVLGTGWGSFSLLRNLDPSRMDISVISPRNHFLFTPLLASTTVGTLEFRSIVEFVRATVRRKRAAFHLSEAVGVDVDARAVRCRSVLDGTEYELPYDRLVMGVGARSNTFNLPGVEEHAFMLKEVRHAQRLRAAIVERLELAMTPGHSESDIKRLLHCVVIGGGPTGVEFSGELYDLMTHELPRYFPEMRRHARVTIIEAGDILSQFDKQLRDYAMRRLAGRAEVAVVQKKVSAVGPTSVSFSDGTSMDAGLVVWSAGVGPQALVAGLPWPKSRQHRLLVDPYLRAYADPSGSVFALGDCSHVVGQPLPATAQVAEREGRYVAQLLNAWAARGAARSGLPDDAEGAGQPTPFQGADPLVGPGTLLPALPPPPPDVASAPFQHANVGMLAYLGGYSALAQLPSARLKGWWSWLLWRSAYLTKLGSWRARLQVPVDWAKTLLMGRDMSRF